MWQEVVITDLTRMSGDRVCIAGLSQNKIMVRPELHRSVYENHLYKEGDIIIRPSAVVAMDLEPMNDHLMPHTEDHLWVNPRNIEFVTLLPTAVWHNVLTWTSFPTVETIFATELVDGKGIKPATGERSLGTIKPQNITEFQYERDRYDNTKYKYRINFEDSSGNEYRYVSVTDLAVRSYCDYLRIEQDWTTDKISDHLFYEHWSGKEVWLRIGLARPFSPKQGAESLCYLQVNGIYTFPDYLNGKCFADFHLQSD